MSFHFILSGLLVFFCQRLITELNIHHIFVISKITDTDTVTSNGRRTGSVHISLVFKADIITGYSPE